MMYLMYRRLIDDRFEKHNIEIVFVNTIEEYETFIKDNKIADCDLLFPYPVVLVNGTRFRFASYGLISYSTGKIIISSDNI